MRIWLGVMIGLAELCRLACASPLAAQTRASSESADKPGGLYYVLRQPEVKLDALQKLLRGFPGGESTEVKLANRDAPRMAHYRYSGGEFKGYYWEERTEDREPMSLLGVWISGFQPSCEGRFVAEMETPVKSGGKMVHSGSWACTMDNIRLFGYVTMLHTGPTARFFMTLPSKPNSPAAEGIDAQIRASLAELIRTP